MKYSPWSAIAFLDSPSLLDESGKIKILNSPARRNPDPLLRGRAAPSDGRKCVHSFSTLCETCFSTDLQLKQGSRALRDGPHSTEDAAPTDLLCTAAYPAAGVLSDSFSSFVVLIDLIDRSYRPSLCVFLALRYSTPKASNNAAPWLFTVPTAGRVSLETSI